MLEIAYVLSLSPKTRLSNRQVDQEADTLRWHETQAVYSCDFQPLPPAQLKRLLPIGHDDDDKEKERERAVIAGGRSYRMATAGGDSKVRVSLLAVVRSQKS